jgi:hypothetical protein
MAERDDDTREDAPRDASSGGSDADARAEMTQHLAAQLKVAEEEILRAEAAGRVAGDDMRALLGGLRNLIAAIEEFEASLGEPAPESPPPPAPGGPAE